MKTFLFYKTHFFGRVSLNPESYLKYFEANIDHYIDQDCEFVPQSIDFLSDDDLHRVKTIIEKRSVERLFDNPLTGKCFDKKHTVHPLNSITFNGKLDELICKLTALEHNESDQVMGDILGFNSFNSNEKNRGIYGSNDDFGIDDCSISMTDNFVVINHFTKTMTPPVEFMKHVCIRYGVSGEMIIDGNTNIDASIAKSDSKGNLSIELRSVESAHDPDDFFS